MPPRMFSSLSAELAGSSNDDSQHIDARQSPASYRPTFTRKLPAMTANLESLVARRKWNRIRSLLSSADSDLLEVYAQNSARDILHILFASDPPLDVVTDLLTLCPSRVEAIDSTGRTPLHMATASGASAEVVEPLIALHPAAAGSRDSRGETPLMLAAAHGKRADSWQGERTVYGCTHCHDPHNPALAPRAPQPPPPVRIGLDRPEPHREPRQPAWAGGGGESAP